MFVRGNWKNLSKKWFEKRKRKSGREADRGGKFLANWKRDKVREPEREVEEVWRGWEPKWEPLSLDSRCEYMASVSSVLDSANASARCHGWATDPWTGDRTGCCSVQCFASLGVTAQSAGCSKVVTPDEDFNLKLASWLTSKKESSALGPSGMSRAGWWTRTGRCGHLPRWRPN